MAQAKLPPGFTATAYHNCISVAWEALPARWVSFAHMGEPMTDEQFQANIDNAVSILRDGGHGVVPFIENP